MAQTHYVIAIVRFRKLAAFFLAWIIPARILLERMIAGGSLDFESAPIMRLRLSFISDGFRTFSMKKFLDKNRLSLFSRNFH